MRGGYELESVKIHVGEETYNTFYFSSCDCTIVVKILSYASGPGPSVVTLTNPTSLAMNAVNTFTVPSDKEIILDANTTYFVEVSSVSADDPDALGDGSITIFRTRSDSDDSGAAEEWSIPNYLRWWDGGPNNPWKLTLRFELEIAIRGTILYSDDATLNDLG